MNHKQGSERNQMFMFSLDISIASDSFVRVVDALVDIDLKSFGFSHVECQEEGRPPYHPSVLIKLYLYGYHHDIPEIACIIMQHLVFNRLGENNNTLHNYHIFNVDAVLWIFNGCILTGWGSP